MRNTGNYFWLLRAVYSSTGGEWPREEATAEADTNREQQLCVSHSSPWMTTAKRASARQKEGESASSLLIYPCHLSVRILHSTWYQSVDIPPSLVTIKPLLAGPHTEGLHIIQ